MKKTFKEAMVNVTKMELPSIDSYSKYLEKIWTTSWITNNGEFAQRLEKRLEEYLQVKHVVVVANGTLALQLVFKALGLKGEVITTPFTFVATTNVIIWEGATPVFADIDPDTFNIDPEDVERKITKKTSAILAVHVYGNPCQIDKLQKISKRYNLKLIYDAAHAFGVEYNKRSVLNYGDASTLSFHATKIFSTAEGGAIIVKDNKLFEKLKLLRNFGIKSEEETVLPGINAKMNELQAALGLCNLKTIDKRIGKSKKIYEKYIQLLKNSPSLKFQKLISSKHNYCYMPVCFKDKKTRDLVYAKLVENNIKPRKYFYPLTSDFEYVKKVLNKTFRKDDVKNAANISGRILCLPIYPSLQHGVIDKISTTINKII